MTTKMCSKHLYLTRFRLKQLSIHYNKKSITYLGILKEDK